MCGYFHSLQDVGCFEPSLVVNCLKSSVSFNHQLSSQPMGTEWKGGVTTWARSDFDQLRTITFYFFVKISHSIYFFCLNFAPVRFWFMFSHKNGKKSSSYIWKAEYLLLCPMINASAAEPRWTVLFSIKVKHGKEEMWGLISKSWQLTRWLRLKPENPLWFLSVDFFSDSLAAFIATVSLS